MSGIQQKIWDCEWRLHSDLGSGFRVQLVVNPREVQLADGITPIQGLLYLDFSLNAYEAPTDNSPRFLANAVDSCHLDCVGRFRDRIANIYRDGNLDTVELETFEGQVKLSVTLVDAIHCRALVKIGFYHPSIISAKSERQPEKDDAQKEIVFAEFAFEIDTALLRSVIEQIGKLLRRLEP
jgi:hypothetical protein